MAWKTGPGALVPTGAPVEPARAAEAYTGPRVVLIPPKAFSSYPEAHAVAADLNDKERDGWTYDVELDNDSGFYVIAFDETGNNVERL